jgi:hypothetical protein
MPCSISVLVTICGWPRHYQAEDHMTLQRTFGAVIVHIASGNIYAAKAGRGDVQWDEVDAANYKTKAEIVAMLEKSIADADATLKSLPDDAFIKSVEPWLSVTEHSAEHYGLLVAYYRANGLVPPESRPKK